MSGGGPTASLSFRLSRSYIIVEWWRTSASVCFKLSRTYIIVGWWWTYSKCELQGLQDLYNS